MDGRNRIKNNSNKGSLLGEKKSYILIKGEYFGGVAIKKDSWYDA